MDSTPKNTDTVQEKYLERLMKIMDAPENDTVEDLTVPHIRPTFQNIYMFLIVMYGILILAGILMNCGMMYHMILHRLHRDPTYAFLINIAILNLIKCLFVLPITLTVMLVENWIFGKFLCYFLPILQDIPIHVSMMTYLLIAGDRYRLLSEPRRPRIPAFVCIVGAWFFAVCIVLPHPIYTTYLDLELYKKKHFRGLGFCVTNLTDNIQQYMRGLFLLTYIAPLAIIAYVYVKSSRELQTLEGPLSVAMYETRTKESHIADESTINNEIPPVRRGQRDSDSSSSISSTGLSGISRSHDVYEAELDVSKEIRTQKYLISMISAFGVLFCPLMVLKLAKLSVIETYENVGRIDMTFTLFIWLAFLSTVSTPGFYVVWQMNRSMKKRLKTNLMFCNRRVSKVSEAVTDVTNDQVTQNVAYDENAESENFANESILISRSSRTVI